MHRKQHLPVNPDIPVPEHPDEPRCARFDLRAISDALHEFRIELSQVNQQLQSNQATLENESICSMVQAYALLDAYINTDVPLLEMGYSRQVLALNHCVLYGTNDAPRLTHKKAIRASEQHFYQDSKVGIGRMVNWYAAHQQQSVWRQAAGVYLNTIGPPQLFMEGNHRTGVLLTNFVLARFDRAPLVLDARFASDWFELTDEIQQRRNKILDLEFWSRSLENELARMIESSVNDLYLLSHSDEQE